MSRVMKSRLGVYVAVGALGWVAACGGTRRDDGAASGGAGSGGVVGQNGGASSLAGTSVNAGQGANTSGGSAQGGNSVSHGGTFVGMAGDGNVIAEAGSTGYDESAGAGAVDCDAGFIAVGRYCAPTLTSLTLTPGVLSAPFAPALRRYGASVNADSASVVATSDVVGATVSINGASSELAEVKLAQAVTPVTIDVTARGITNRYVVSITRFGGQQAYIKAAQPGTSDNFGFPLQVSADGARLLVAAQHEDSASRGVNGDDADTSAPSSGAAYVFRRDGGTWVQEAYLKASNSEALDNFGLALSISADGSVIAVGAPAESSAAKGVDGNQDDNSAVRAGAVYVFRRSGTSWHQESYLKASNTEAEDAFGSGLALSADGNTLAVNAFTEGSGNGDQADNSQVTAGAVYVFAHQQGGWQQTDYIKAPHPATGDYFGAGLAFSGDGTILAICAGGESSAATGIDGNDLDTSAPMSGALYLFARAGKSWANAAYIKPFNTGAMDNFCGNLALSEDASVVAVGAPHESSNATGIDGDPSNDFAVSAGAAYIFRRSGDTWKQDAYVKASNTNESDHFGTAVALSADGKTLAIGAPQERSAARGVNGDQADNSEYLAGAAYVFRHDSAGWRQQAYLKASNPKTIFQFGFSLSLSADGTMLAVGSPNEDGASGGINGDEDNRTPGGSGAVYVKVF